jgi:hypothetical protein
VAYRTSLSRRATPSAGREPFLDGLPTSRVLHHAPLVAEERPQRRVGKRVLIVEDEYIAALSTATEVDAESGLVIGPSEPSTRTRGDQENG